ncbi:MAG: TIGR02646 family protein [Candidatus Aminicenantes bacterium]|nr:TIGR02646 family protein [Candidatus Aminicenantes bacterium]
MLEIKKVEPPTFFKSWVKDKKDSQRLREFILEKEQQHVCCYCEKGITPDNSDSHLDHVRPQHRFPKLKNDYRNLVVSCQTPGRCGIAKKSKFDDHFIVPTEENPEDYLTYFINGEIRAIDNNKKANVTIEMLNLNAPRLVEVRRALFRQLNDMKNSIADFEIYFNEYPTFIKYFKESFNKPTEHASR